LRQNLLANDESQNQQLRQLRNREREQRRAESRAESRAKWNKFWSWGKGGDNETTETSENWAEEPLLRGSNDHTTETSSVSRTVTAENWADDEV